MRSKGGLRHKSVNVDLRSFGDLLSCLVRALPAAHSRTEHGKDKEPSGAFDMLVSQPFMRALSLETINVPAVAQMYAHLSEQDATMAEHLIMAVVKLMAISRPQQLLPFSCIFEALLRVDDNISQQRVDLGMSQLLKQLTDGETYIDDLAPSIQALCGIAQRSPLVAGWLAKHHGKWLEPWLLLHDEGAVRKQALHLVLVITGLHPAANASDDHDDAEASGPAPANRRKRGRAGRAAEASSVAAEAVALAAPAAGEVVPQRQRTILGALAHILLNAKSRLETDEVYRQAETPLEVPRSYFRLEALCAATQMLMDTRPQDFALFAAEDKTQAFIKLLWSIDGHRIECDENKWDLLCIWIKAMRVDPAIAKRFAADVENGVRLMDFFVCLRGTENAMAYNRKVGAAARSSHLSFRA